MHHPYLPLASLIAVVAAPASATAAAPAAAPRATPRAAPAAPEQPLTRAALIKAVDAQFKAIDTNGDGFLEPNEIAAAELKSAQNRVAAVRARMEAEFNKLDTNKDGKLSLAEFLVAAPQAPTVAPDMTAAFTQLDTNKDGKVTADEFRAVAAGRFDRMDTKHAGVLTVPGATGSQPKTISRADFLKQADAQFKTIDTAGHGFFTKPELAAAELRLRQQRAAQGRARLQAEFTKLNTSHSGQLSLAEFMAAAPQAPTAAPDPSAIMAQLDKNHDGKVTPDEFRAPRLAVFDKIDTDHNGVIEPAERAAAQAAAQRH